MALSAVIGLAIAMGGGGVGLVIYQSKTSPLYRSRGSPLWGTAQQVLGWFKPRVSGVRGNASLNPHGIGVYIYFRVKKGREAFTSAIDFFFFTPQPSL